MRPAFRSLVPALQALGASSVPVVGTFAAGWSAATALALYWCENLLGALLISILIACHRRLTRKRGHWRSQLGTRTRTIGKVRGKRVVHTPKESGDRSFFSEFLSTSLAFNLAHGVFLALLLGIFLPRQGATPVDPAALRNGLVAMAVVLLAGFAFNLVRLRDRPFAWLRRSAQLSLGRMALIHLSILFGVFLAATTGRPERFFLLFIVLKLIADVATSLPFLEVKMSGEIPRWALWLARKGQPEMTEEEVREDWRETVRQERETEERDEEEKPLSRSPSAR
jgi:hypothetical protein